MNTLLNILALITLFETMLLVGLTVGCADVVAALKDAGLVLRSMIANYILVPIITVALLMAFQTSPMVSIGFLLLAACPGGAYGPPFTTIAMGNTGAAAGIMVLLAGSSPFLSPLLLRFLVPLFAGADNAGAISISKIVIILICSQILPLLIGTLFRRYYSKSVKLIFPVKIGAQILNVLLLACVLYVQFDSLREVRTQGYLGMLILLAASAVTGWLFGGRESSNRKALTLTTAVRNNAVGMVLATGAFAGTAAVPAAAIYGIVGFVGGFFIALLLRLLPPGRHHSSAFFSAAKPAGLHSLLPAQK